jgi:hypothetical protein
LILKETQRKVKAMTTINKNVTRGLSKLLESLGWQKMSIDILEVTDRKQIMKYINVLKNDIEQRKIAKQIKDAFLSNISKLEELI